MKTQAVQVARMGEMINA